MREYALALVALFLTSITVPLATAQEFGEPQTEPVFETYSGAVQRAFFQVEAAESQMDLGAPEEWLVLTTLDSALIQRHISADVDIRMAPFLDGAWIWSFSNPELGTSILEELENRGIIERSLPQREKIMQPRAVLDDPEMNAQWHLINTGQNGGTVGEDANVTAAWDIADGTGVQISIIDDGFAHSHTDLSPGYQSADSYDYCSNDGDPTPSSNHGHGTSAAGVAGGRGNNTYGIAGVAYNSDMSGTRLIACGFSDSTAANALSLNDQANDIYSNSWGPSDDGETLEGPGPLLIAAFESDFTTGRGGLGNIITWAGGNGHGDSDNSNYDGYANARQTISVGAITNSGTQSWYSEEGANVLVVAHSNGGSLGIVTADIPGSGGYNSSGDVARNFGGTSSATPLVSGVAALILDVDPTLTARDVMAILAKSARKNDPSDSSWSTNGAGHEISHTYGFGVVDAHAAVSLAANWTKLQTEASFSSSMSTVSSSIADNGAPVTDTITINQDLRIEYVEVVVNISHTARGDLEIILTSPDGTDSILAEEHSDSGNDYTAWSFGSVRHMDEFALGDWTLSIEDKANGDTGTFDDWHLVFHGVNEGSDTDGDGISDMNETNIHNTNPNLADTDGDGLNDGDELFNESTDPLNVDSDGDGLNDGVEVLVNGTNPNLADTDGDGLTDGQEVLIHNSDPLVFDDDADSDLYYWFQDCDDTDPNINPGRPELLNGIDDDCDMVIDEGYNFIDTDSDGLSDYDEYHVYGTNQANSDTDGDGLIDGDEVNIHSTDPLVVDLDADSDGYYWFQDCDDNESAINPGAIEILDGTDQNCNTEIDETFVTTDFDMDGLYDYEEYHNYSTNHMDNDTDGDGLDDGTEVLQYMTDPLVPEIDADSDGTIWLFDCNDNVSTIYPGATELWNNIDDDCDSIIDEDIDRESGLTQYPSIFIDHTITDSEITLSFSGIPEGVEFNQSWTRDGKLMNETGDTLTIPIVDCLNPANEFESILCVQERITVAYRIHLEDANSTIELGWTVRLIANKPPEPEPTPEPEPEPEPICEEDDTQPAGDGCNVCACDSGQWVCTEMVCMPVDDDDDETMASNEESNFLDTYGVPQEILIGMGVLFVLLVVALILRGGNRSDHVEAWSPPPIHNRQRIGFDIPEAPNFDDDPWSGR